MAFSLERCLSIFDLCLRVSFSDQRFDLPTSNVSDEVSKDFRLKHRAPKETEVFQIQIERPHIQTTIAPPIAPAAAYLPPECFVANRIVRPRMACTYCETIQRAALPSRPIERGRPAAGLLAHVFVIKYADHLPLYRQSQIFEREGLDLSRSTLTNWVDQSTALLEPLADAIEDTSSRGKLSLQMIPQLTCWRRDQPRSR